MVVKTENAWRNLDTQPAKETDIKREKKRNPYTQRYTDTLSSECEVVRLQQVKSTK